MISSYSALVPPNLNNQIQSAQTYKHTNNQTNKQRTGKINAKNDLALVWLLHDFFNMHIDISG